MKNSLNLKVYYKDTDAEGVVYYTKYLEMMEMGRTELINDIGIPLTKLKKEHNIVFAVRKVNCEYLSPAFYADDLIIESRIEKTSGATLTFKQDIIRKSDKTLLCSAITLLTSIDITKLKPKKIPETARNMLHNASHG